MPPKRASTRRTGSVARSTDFQNSPSYLPNVMSPETNNPALPDIPVKHSFAYGASSTPLLPRRIAAKPTLGLAEVADAIDQDIKSAQNREDDRPQRNLRSRRPSVSASISPVRRSRREPTPDQVQLLESLREVTVSPQAGQSTPTPTPPIPHTLSTTSSPATQTLINPRHAALQHDPPLYPSPLLRVGSSARDISLSSPNFRNSVDNESLISWTVERDIHGDDLQRTQTRYRPEPQGTTISAPPRRFSGLAFGHSTIEEEEEPESVLSAKSPSPKPAQPQPKAQPQPQPEPEPESSPSPESESEPEPEPEPEPQPRPASRSSHRSRSNARSESAQPAPFASSARVRTIIPNRITREASFREASPPIREHAKRASPLPNNNTNSNTQSSQKNVALRFLSYVLVVAISIFTIYSFGDNLSDLSCDICTRLSWGRGMPHINLNSTGMEAVSSLSNQVMRIGAQVSSLSRDLRDMKSEVDNVAAAPAPTTIVQRLPSSPEAPKINFLSLGMGAIIDPWNTSPSPSVGRPPSWHQKFTSYFQFTPYFTRTRKPHPGVAALIHWEDVGDCWCSAPLSGMSQLSVLLGRSIVPEEVVVEHIPRDATPRPGLAPANMELWAEFSVIDSDDTTSTTKSSGSSPRIDSSRMPEGFSLHETVMNTLRVAYRGEPETAYSDDELLGSSFYRIGKWKYDINAASNIQRFDLDAIIDIPAIRVDHVVFRVTSNWGANATCIYRLKLYGHV